MYIVILKKYFVFLLIFLMGFKVVCASGLEITEVMYDPQGANTSHQWIEVYNNSGDSIDLSTWSVTDFDTTWHFRAISSDSTTVLAPNSYVLIAKTSNLADFKSKNTNLVGQILKANMTLGADSGKIGLSPDKKNIESEVSYSSIMDNGKSLQKIDNVWIEATSTPGTKNTNTVMSTNDSSSNADSNITSDESMSTSSSTYIATNGKSEVYTILTKIIAPKVVTSTLEFSINSITTTSKKETLDVGKYVWSFGDGTSLEAESSKEFKHIYSYPGDYVLKLSFYGNRFKEIPDSVSRMEIKVIPADIIVSSVGTPLDSFIELQNKSTYEIDLSGWVINGVNHRFIIPIGTIILPNHKLKVSPKITGFNGDDINDIKVTNNTGEIISIYPVEEISISKNNISNYNKPFVASYSNSTSNDNAAPVIDLNNLGASVGDANNLNIKSIYAWLGLIGIIILGTFIMFIVRKKNVIPDYLEQEVRAEDMTIIE